MSPKRSDAHVAGKPSIQCRINGFVIGAGMESALIDRRSSARLPVLPQSANVLEAKLLNAANYIFTREPR